MKNTKFKSQPLPFLILLLQLFFASCFTSSAQSKPTAFHKPPDRSPILEMKFQNGFKLEAIDTLQKQYRFERVARLEKSTQYTVDLFFKTDQPLLPATQTLLQNRLQAIGAGFLVPTTFLTLENGFIFRNHINLQKNPPLLRLLRQEMAYPGLDATTPPEVSAQLQTAYQLPRQYLLIAGPWASVLAQKIAEPLIPPNQNIKIPGHSFQSLKLFNRFKDDFIFPTPMIKASFPWLQFILLPTEDEKKQSLLLQPNPFSTGLLPYVPAPPTAFQTILEFLDRFRFTPLSPFFFPSMNAPTPPPPLILDIAAFPSTFHPLTPQPPQDSFQTILAYLDRSPNQQPLTPIFFPTLPKVEPPKPPHFLQILMTLPVLSDTSALALQQQVLRRIEQKMQIICPEAVPEKIEFSPIQEAQKQTASNDASVSAAWNQPSKADQTDKSDKARRFNELCQLAWCHPERSEGSPNKSLRLKHTSLNALDNADKASLLSLPHVAMYYEIQYPNDTASLQIDLIDAFNAWRTETAAELNSDPNWQLWLQESAEQFNALNENNDKACTAVEFALCNAQKVHWFWNLEQEKSKLAAETFQKAWGEQLPGEILVDWDLPPIRGNNVMD